MSWLPRFSTARWIASSAVAIALLGSEIATRAQTPPPAVTFRDAALAARAPMLWQCVAPPSGWVRRDVDAQPRHETWWCPPTAANCGDLTQPPDEYITLRTIAGVDDEVLELLARRRTSRALVVTVSLQPWTGGFDFQFDRGTDHVTLAASAEFTWRDLSFATEPRHIDADVHRWFDAELAPWTRSESSFRDEGERLMNRLRSLVNDSARRPLLTCDQPNAPGRLRFMQTPQGEGAFDTCPRRALDEQEVRALVRAADRDIDARLAFVRSNAREMYRSLLDVVPLDHCWHPLTPH